MFFFPGGFKISRKWNLTWILASVGDDFSVLVLERSDRRLDVVAGRILRLRRIRQAVGRIDALRNKSGKLESVLRPNPIRQSVFSLFGHTCDIYLQNRLIFRLRKFQFFLINHYIYFCLIKFKKRISIEGGDFSPRKRTWMIILHLNHLFPQKVIEWW